MVTMYTLENRRDKAVAWELDTITKDPKNSFHQQSTITIDTITIDTILGRGRNMRNFQQDRCPLRQKICRTFKFSVGQILLHTN